MAIVRAILAAMISLSVALIPATAGGLISAKPVEMTMAGQTDAPCCPCCNDQGDFKCSTACAIKCMSFFAAILPMATLPPHLIEMASASIADNILHGHERRPPTHPPPV
jgi:hypothetical protein